MPTTKKEHLAKIKSLADQVKVCMFTTCDKDNNLRSRPMQTTEIEENGKMWFFTNQYSDKVDEFQENRTVNLAYSDPSAQDYLSITGKARLVNDMAKIKELWNPILKAWFPQGLDSPKLALVEVTPTAAEYWDSNSSKIIQMFNIGRAILQGKRQDEVSDSEHATVDL